MMFGWPIRSKVFGRPRKTTQRLLTHPEREYECLPFPLKNIHIPPAKYFLKRHVSGRVRLLIRPEFFIKLCQKLFLLQVIAEIAGLCVVVPGSVAVEFVS